MQNINKLSNTLIDSCDRLYKRKIINEKAYNNCKKMKSINLPVDPKSVKDLEDKLYQNNIDNYNKIADNNYKSYETKMKNINENLSENEKQKIYNLNTHKQYSYKKNVLTRNLNNLNKEISIELKNIKKNIQNNLKNDKYKELVSNYSAIENNRNKESTINKSLSQARERIIHSNNKIDREKFNYYINIVLHILLLAVFIILFIVYFNKL